MEKWKKNIDNILKISRSNLLSFLEYTEKLQTWDGKKKEWDAVALNTYTLFRTVFKNLVRFHEIQSLTHIDIIENIEMLAPQGDENRRIRDTVIHFFLTDYNQFAEKVNKIFFVRSMSSDELIEFLIDVAASTKTHRKNDEESDALTNILNQSSEFLFNP